MIKAGDKVSWTHVSASRRTMSMTLREGVVVAVMGDVATIKQRSGRRVEIYVKRLRLDGQRSQIDEFVTTLREAHRSEGR